MLRSLLCSVMLLVAVACPGGEKRPTSSVERRPTEIPPEVGPTENRTQYTLTFEDAHHHYVKVRAVYPAGANVDVVLSLPVWTPGSYLVREYAQHVEELRAASLDGAPLPVAKIRKNRWQVHTGASAGLVVEYKLYCKELTVRSNFVDADTAVLNGAATFLRMIEEAPRAASVELVVPKGWKNTVTGLEPLEVGTPNLFLAKTYDELVDSPLVAGRELLDQTFEIEGVAHHMTHLGDYSQWDTEEVLADVEQLSRAAVRFWGVLPYEHYHFLNLILGGGGGLEHLDSTLMLADAFRTRTRSDYHNWLGLVAHEFFHTWNVKRLRPKGLGPFDYENEVHTESLWIAEGITSYYDDLLLRRAGILDDKEYLQKLSGQIRALQTTPGRRVQSLSESSYDSWIKYYRRNENSSNTGISYYTKGAVVAFLLDTQIRIESGGTKSLDDVMRAMYERYSGEQGYTPEEFRTTTNEIAGRDMSAFFASAVDSTDELDYAPALAYFGLKLKTEEEESTRAAADEDDDEKDDPPADLGLVMSGSTVRRVVRETPAYEAGFNVDDEVIAIDGYRLQGDLESLLAKFRPEQKLTITIARRGRLRDLAATAGKKPATLWDLSIDGSRSQLQQARFEQWLAEYANL